MAGHLRRILRVMDVNLTNEMETWLEAHGYHRSDSIYLFPWHKLQKAHIDVLCDQLKRLYKPKLIQPMLSALRRVITECYAYDLISSEEYHRLVDIQGPKIIAMTAGRPVTLSEINGLIENCLEGNPIGVRDAAILAVFKTGIRIKELTSLNLSEFDWYTGQICILHSKTNHERYVYVLDTDLPLMMAWLEIRGKEEGPLFVRMPERNIVHELNRLSPDGIRKMLKKRISATGSEKFTPHDIRRGIITALLDKGIDPRIVQSIAGHASPNTTFEHYDRRGPSAQQRAVLSLNLPFPPET